MITSQKMKIQKMKIQKTTSISCEGFLSRSIFVMINLILNLIFFNVWAFLVVQLVKNPPTMQETPVQFLGQEDPLERG